MTWAPPHPRRWSLQRGGGRLGRGRGHVVRETTPEHRVSRPWALPGSSNIPTVWRTPCTGRPTSLTIAVKCERSTGRSRRFSPWQPHWDFRSGWSLRRTTMMGVGRVGLAEDRFGSDATGHDHHHGGGDRTVTAALSSPPRRGGRTRWPFEEGVDLLTAACTAFEVSGRGDLLAEAYRLQGELLLRQSVPGRPSRSLLPAGPGHRPWPAS
jgi:hypothetical protein